MGKVIKKIKIVCFIIILLEIAGYSTLTGLYFTNTFNVKAYVNDSILLIILGALIVFDALFVWLMILLVGHLRNKADLKAADVIGSDIQEAYNFGMLGLVVTDENDVVIWTNDLFIDRHIDILDCNIVTLYPELEKLKNYESSKIGKVVINNRNYEVKYLPEALLWIFKDNTDYENIFKYSKEQAPVVGLLSIDNYVDVIRGEDDFNDAITKLKNLIFNYTKEYGILVRRYRDDTYLLLCNYDSFTRMEADKFSIVDKARDIFKDEEIPLTLSIGIAYDFPDVVKLNEMAATALNIAMSRGGDQVVVSAYGRDMAFFGGKSQAQETRNRVKTRVYADSLISLIKGSSNVLVMGHKFTDMDALGSCLGIKAICNRLGVDSKLVIDFKNTEPKTKSALLSQFSKDELEELMVSPQDAKELMHAETILVVCDVHTANMCIAPELVELASKVVVIDHHRRGEDYIESPVFNYIDPSASSASEIITQFIRFCSLSPRVDIPQTYATIMLSGIFLDSTYFKSKQTGVRTFEASSILKEYGADNAIADDLLKDDFEEYKTINDMIKNIKIPHYGVVYALGDEDTIYDTTTIAKACNTCLTMKGIHAAFVIARVNNKECHMSARSDGSINVQILAEKLGGGGHFTMAASHFETNDLHDIERQLLEVFNRYLNEAKADAKSRRNEE